MAWAGSHLPTQPLTWLKEDMEDNGTKSKKENEWVNTRIVHSQSKNAKEEIKIGDLIEFPPLVSVYEENDRRMQEY